MQKRFYVIVPVDASNRRPTMLETFLGWLNPDDTASKAAQRKREFTEQSRTMRDRVNLVQAGLENIGLGCHRLDTHELIELYYKIYNPKTSQEQKLPTNEELHLDKTTL
jgi:hypothetical protein